MRYTTEDALRIARQLEPVLADAGFHVAIGGSLVYRGTSEKDIDVFIYPHSREVEMNLNFILQILAGQGYRQRKDTDLSTHVPDVWVALGPGETRVDFFFMSRVERNYPQP